MSERRSQVDDFARLTEETERLARHVEDLRLRIAATTAKRRASSGMHPAQHGASLDGAQGALTERPPQGPSSDRPPYGTPSERPPHGSPSERALEAVAALERPVDAGLERAHDAGTERPDDAIPERPRPRQSPFPERPSCLASVSRWLPPLRPGRHAMESGVHEKAGEAGRYCIVTPRQKKPSSLPPKRRTPKADVA
ncbi:hypothetical protein [Sorangium cellulosum]|uniref:Uncharacterized protein n=1 Tax=Sorangium cellulosum TaxID=56 RepID=A0A150QG82_SORCE|nr:hypothetical protein [Sorangium cellulosum]KYF66941.1 hypothetical protein BE15_46415 [Sorangium cellulosum]